jgi:hypothetical protein
MLAQSGTQPFYVIGNDIGTSEIDQETIADIFNAEQTFWSNRRPLVLVMHSAKSEYLAKTAAMFYDGSVKSLQRFWLSVVFQGRGSAPMYFLTEKELIDYVAETPGAIAIIYDSPGPKELRIKVTASK